MPSSWWVNHKQTFRQELSGGYIWPPKSNSNGAQNRSYDNLTKVQPGDIIFSYAETQIKAIGQISGKHKEATKPEEFGNSGDNWSQLGWLVPVEWTRLDNPLRPKAHIDIIGPLLPERYSPLQKNGNGNQGCYLASISNEPSNTLIQLTGFRTPYTAEALRQAEDDIEQEIEADPHLSSTEKQQLVKARRGQGKYRQNLEAIESCCRLTGTDDPRFLVASHIKPWRDASNQERLDGHNGFLLAPHVDRLFDRGWISFSDNGTLLIADDNIKQQLLNVATKP